jgi:hypothetical protein
MPNPTGTSYLSANQNYAWADGDVYQIEQTDAVEYAAPGASFGGLGVENQPHQALLNKIQFVYRHLLADEQTLNRLAAILNALTCGVNLNPPAPSLPNLYGSQPLPTKTNGWLKASTNDVNLGQIQLIWQWGVITLLPWVEEYPPSQPEEPILPVSMEFSFPIPFPNACWAILPYLQTSDTTDPLGWANGAPQDVLTLAPITPLQPQNNKIVYSLTDNAFQSLGASLAYGNRGGITGIGWLAVGY